MKIGDPSVARIRTVDYMNRRRCRKPVGMMVVARLSSWRVRQHRNARQAWYQREPWWPGR